MFVAMRRVLCGPCAVMIALWACATGVAAADDVFVIQVSVTLDSSPPTGSVTINADAEWTTQLDVALALDASDPVSTVAEMRFGNDGTVWSPWEPYATTKAWSLAMGDDGARTVYVQYRDAEGNVSEGDITDVILLDQTPPSVTAVAATPHEASEGQTVELSFNVSEALADLPEVTVNDHPAINESGKSVCLYSYTVLDPGQDPIGPAHIEIECVDLAGNVSVSPNSSALIIVDDEVRMPAPVWPVGLMLLGAAFWRLRRRRIA